MKWVWLIWAGFLLSVALVLAAMAWSSRAVLDLEQAEKQARQQAALEESVRLALWRMDSTLAPIVAQESVRPSFAYRSPGATDRSPWVLLHFQYGPDGRLTSPQVYQAKSNRSAAMNPQQRSVEEARQRLERFQRLTTRAKLLEMLPERAAAPNAVVVSETPALQQSRASQEFNRRAQAVSQNRDAMVQNQIVNSLPTVPINEMGGAIMEPLWIGDQLLLARRTIVAEREYVQGCLLDWPAIRQSLLRDVKDLLPGADLKPAEKSVSAAESRMLAALPMRLIPGELAGTVEEGPGPATLSLLAAWAAIALAAVSVAVLLAGIVRLSRRRAAFVSAVTHELRTPLTTFQLYSEMLAEGMVPESQRVSYLRTLHSEAQRLAHLVENVLAYARLERGRVGGNIEKLTAGDLLRPIRQQLADVAARAGMELVVETDANTLAAGVRANRSSLEQILLNLVDNAAKYANAASDKRIHLSATVTGSQLEIRVSDHGPGVSPPALRRLFRPFARSAQEAAGSAPGVGVGLALSRRLACDMGARLKLDRRFEGGACFVLAMPLAGV